MSYTRDQRIEFIESVKRRPLLYNANDDFYHDRGETPRAWAEVVKECNFIKTVDKAKALWSRLRTSYVEHINSPDKKKCKFVNELSFLSSQNCLNIEEPNTTDDQVLNMPKTEKCNNEDDSEDNKVQNDQVDSHTASSSNSTMSNNDTNDATATCSYEPNNDQDDLTQFFNSLCVTAKKLPKKAQQDIKEKLFQIVNRDLEQNDP
ncbi:GSCOCG00006228001-RA-CDS [Cotesia congregata]|uniref:MADF domain-containing protein n=1 Tax=Cotesia congregata TaxID=51543 RepID=A0A8J2HCA4_COTCN|nr:GSCOCG00006228001-RA-CDS [Cotesia congregata]CAG5093758.1 Protein of unknown function [Cotesia congregata]